MTPKPMMWGHSPHCPCGYCTQARMRAVAPIPSTAIEYGAFHRNLMKRARKNAGLTIWDSLVVWWQTRREKRSMTERQGPTNWTKAETGPVVQPGDRVRAGNGVEGVVRADGTIAFSKPRPVFIAPCDIPAEAAVDLLIEGVAPFTVLKVSTAFGAPIWNRPDPKAAVPAGTVVGHALLWTGFEWAFPTEANMGARPHIGIYTGDMVVPKPGDTTWHLTAAEWEEWDRNHQHDAGGRDFHTRTGE